TGRPADALLFTDMGKVAKHKGVISIALRMELVECVVQHESAIDISVRMLVAKKKLLTITLDHFSVDSTGLTLTKSVKVAKINTSIADPSYFALTSMKPIDGRVTPKYAILSGAEGTEVVRICEKK
ncbi:hypothetical protein PFISCL1PPCAC_22235, partial [Pristionchus fissidentatus]